MSSVYFDPAVGGDGSTVTDDSNPATGLANGGHRARFVPALAQMIGVGNFVLTKAGDAAADAAEAQAWATQLGTPVSGGEYSAKYHAQSAAGSASSASGYATTSQAWAVQLGTPVSGGEYSAKYHAQASASSATLASSWATQLVTPVSGGEYSAKYHAQAAASSAAAAASSAGSLSLPTLTAGDSGRPMRVNPAGNGWELGGRLRQITYDNRADLRAITSPGEDLALVDGLGLFQHFVGVDEGPDDDETAFETATGFWLLICPTWEVVEANTLLAEDIQDAASARYLQKTEQKTALSIAANSTTTFTVNVLGAAIGASVLVTPPGSPTLKTITMYAYVSSGGTITVYVGNADASTSGGFNAGDWLFTVINRG